MLLLQAKGLRREPDHSEDGHLDTPKADARATIVKAIEKAENKDLAIKAGDNLVTKLKFALAEGTVRQMVEAAQ